MVGSVGAWQLTGDKRATTLTISIREYLLCPNSAYTHANTHTDARTYTHAGIPAKVSASESLPAYPSWQQLLAAPAGGFSFDPGQLSLWIKLVNSSSAVITLA